MYKNLDIQVRMHVQPTGLSDYTIEDLLRITGVREDYFCDENHSKSAKPFESPEQQVKHVWSIFINYFTCMGCTKHLRQVVVQSN